GPLRGLQARPDHRCGPGHHHPAVGLRPRWHYLRRHLFLGSRSVEPAGVPVRRQWHRPAEPLYGDELSPIPRVGWGLPLRRLQLHSARRARPPHPGQSADHPRARQPTPRGPETTPRGLSYVNGRLWVTYDSGKLYELDAVTGQVLSTFTAPAGSAGERPFGLAFDGQSLWLLHDISASSEILRMDIS